ncbi:hypothetical protein QBZ16_003231 [Prototheca wickerhamii]|uniref:tRNA (guanine(46)-N(7))-methyltransferase n=1 Tax=Prototheca wickerhamii TaxID=3111 RepID=A0AAD9MNB4_PROWI|nr:hypothetical protein QBZ16_003231 [Prototheca wickerhamii]
MGSQHPAITDDTIFPGLGLNEKLFSEVGSHRRGRQHVNPLKLDLMSPPGPMDWPLLFSNPHLPLVVDVGSGYGRFCLAMAKVEEEGGVPHNYLGIEIRDAAVDRANEWASALGLAGRVRFLLANATLFLDQILDSYPAPIDLITIQYPDPQFKRRHRKRRIVQPSLVDAAARRLAPGGRVLLQSDVLEVGAEWVAGKVAEDMRDHFAANSAFELESGHGEPRAVFFHASTNGIEKNSDMEQDTSKGIKSPRFRDGGWLHNNPLVCVKTVPTEREVLTLARGDPVFRVLVEKRADQSRA